MPDYGIESWSYSYEIVYFVQTRYLLRHVEVKTGESVLWQQVLTAGFLVIG